MREMIRIIKEHNSEYVDRSKINIQDVGQKAWGLCQMPVAWTPPFSKRFRMPHFTFSEML